MGLHPLKTPAGPTRAPFPGATAFSLALHILTETLPGVVLTHFKIFFVTFFHFSAGQRGKGAEGSGGAAEAEAAGGGEQSQAAGGRPAPQGERRAPPAGTHSMATTGEGDGNGLISWEFVSWEENATKMGLSRRKPNRSSPPRTWRRASRSAWTTPAATTSPSTGRAAWPGAPRCPNGASGRDPQPLPAPAAPIGNGIVGQTGSGEKGKGKRLAVWWNRVVSRRSLSSCSGFLRSLGFDFASCCGVVPRTRCPATPWYLPAPCVAQTPCASGPTRRFGPSSKPGVRYFVKKHRFGVFCCVKSFLPRVLPCWEGCRAASNPLLNKKSARGTSRSCFLPFSALQHPLRGRAGCSPLGFIPQLLPWG